MCAANATDAASVQDDESVRIDVVAERDALVPGTTTFVGVRFRIAPKWHTYWDGLNDTGVAPRVTFDAVEGLTFGPAMIPAPHRMYGIEGITDYIHEDEVTLVVPVTVAEGVTGGSVTLKASCEWLVCDANICVLGDGVAEATLPVRASADRAAEQASAIESARRRVAIRPESRSELAALGIRTSWSSQRMTVRAPGATRLAFYPHETSSRPLNPRGDGVAEGTALRVTFEPSEEQSEGEIVARGVLHVQSPADGGEGVRDRWIWIDSAPAG